MNLYSLRNDMVRLRHFLLILIVIGIFAMAMLITGAIGGYASVAVPIPTSISTAISTPAAISGPDPTSAPAATGAPPALPTTIPYSEPFASAHNTLRNTAF